MDGILKGLKTIGVWAQAAGFHLDVEISGDHCGVWATIPGRYADPIEMRIERSTGEITVLIDPLEEYVV